MNQFHELLQLLQQFGQVALFVGIVVIAHFVYDLLKRKHNSRQPVIEVKARVVGKRLETSRPYGRYYRDTYHYYYVSFKPEDGSPAVEFQVSDILYNSYEYGEVDLLRYRGWDLLTFGGNLEEVKPIAPLPEEHNWQSKDESRWQRMICWINAKLWDWADYPLRVWEWLSEVIAGAAEKRRENVMKKGKQQNQQEADGILTHELDE